MTTLASAKSRQLALCHDCHLLVDWSAVVPGQRAICPRCGARVHQRKPDSIRRTWALLIAACVLYLPANLLPMTESTSLGSVQSDTILSGVIYFLQDGSFVVGTVIFVASIFVPLMKMLILSYLLLTLHFKSLWRPKDRTRLYRLTEVVGRWSMVDIYVLTIMVALVKLGALANVEAGPAALYFAAVVVLTMLAAESFDSRLIWDIIEGDHVKA